AEEDPAGLCYTSGTTGKPKGVLYSHRGLVLHSIALRLADTAAVSASDVCMPVVPMFHVNAWGVPFAATWMGSTQVLPAPMPTPESLDRKSTRLNSSHVSISYAVFCLRKKRIITVRSER